MGNKPNQVRIIAGQWRGRKLSFPDEEGLRPTPDRLRETLFNWLAPTLPGASCLDLFAGSGALGFESASRGAKRVVLVEKNIHAHRALKQNCQLLGDDSIELLQLDALRYLDRTAEAFDIVFLDPPFDSGLLEPVCVRLQEAGWIAESGMIYVETPGGQTAGKVPEEWVLQKEKRAGQVACKLFRCVRRGG